MYDNVRLYPWFGFFTNLLFWQGVWFLYIEGALTPADAILMYAIYDISTTVLEVPLGYLSDRVGRRITLVLSSVGLVISATMQAIGGGFWLFALAQVALGASKALESGTSSALLYESLARDGRADQIEAEELRAWRYQFTALALSALLGGLMAQQSFVLAYWATALAAAGALVLAWRFTEPPHAAEETGPVASTLGQMLMNPVLIWCMVLALAMYIFSHVPFVFGQPFIESALAAEGWSAEAPLVSGTVSAVMMVVSVGTSWLAPAVRRAVGLGCILLLAFSMQIGLVGALAVSGEVLIIGLLLLRMVPDSLARPFLLARIQPLLADRRRATYLSIQSFAGRLLFALSLIVLSGDASGAAVLDHAALREILLWYVGAGLAVLAGLAVTVRVLGPGRDPS